ncbi:salicylate hydroxylase [Lentinula aciculospora]|uniref:Salicylate hydroxylase n=1 Tax=Lentinula aciculospora TaxID=153920 RepID=A0A9W9ALP0_9AGAR|nr:salicylate hydroxylase [Lentinula aciculospora]
MSSSKDFTVAICGGGLCGLACAVALSRAGISVTVFEASSFSQESGAGVGLGRATSFIRASVLPNAVRALKGLGIFDAILARSDQPEPAPRLFGFVSAKDPHDFIFSYETRCEDPVALAIYRPAFLEALLSLLDPSIIHFQKRCTSVNVSETGKHVMYFTDDTIHEADLVIGADGVRSVTRRYVIGQVLKNPLAYPNTAAYRGLVPTEDLRRAGVQTNLTGRPICFLGSGKHMICFPIKGATVINIVVFVTDYDKPPQSELPYPWVESASQIELKDSCKDWGHDPMIILDHLKNPSKWSIHALDPPLRSYVRDNVVLVGDASHAMLPHLGAGVGQGFEDVFVLVQLLTHSKTQKFNLCDVLAQYDNVRPPRANGVLQASARVGRLYDSFRSSEQDEARLQQGLSGMWENVWGHDLYEDVAAAFESLHRLQVF